MTRAADAIESVLSRPRLLAPILGIIAATGFQPLGLWPLTLLAIGAFALLIERAPHWRRAALLGWLFGLAHFTFANAWIATAFTYQAQMPPALGWVAVPLLSLYLAVYPALAAAGAKLVAQRGGRMALLLAFAGCWIISEWLRSWVFTGFPWNPLGVVLLGPFDRPGLAAVAPWFGTYALSGLVGALWRRPGAGGARAPLVRDGNRCRASGPGNVSPAGRAAPGHLHFTIVQPDVPQGQLDDQRFYEANFQKTAALTLPDPPGTQRLVLWPESGLPDLLREGYPQRYYDAATAFADPRLARQRIGRVIGPESLLLTGAVDLRLSNGARGRRLQRGHCDRFGRRDRRKLRQGASRALRRVSRTEVAARTARGAAPGGGIARLHSRSGAAHARPWPMGQWRACRSATRSSSPARWSIATIGPTTSSTIPTTAGSALSGHRNTSRKRACGRSRRACRSCARRRPESAPSSMLDGAVRQHLPLHRSGRLDGVIPPALAPTPFSQLGNILPLGWALLVLSLARVAMRRRAR